MLQRAVLVAALACVSAAATAARAGATPLADVPADHWAYAAIQTLAADGLIDGYPDGTFKGDRPLTRYEMAAIVARVIAKIQAEGAGTASKADLDKLQKLIDALKDELDGLGVRVTAVEDAVAALDRRTRAAQALSVHGTLLADGSLGNAPVTPRNVAGGGIDRFVQAYAGSPSDNDPLREAANGRTILRSDARFNFIYAVDPNVRVSVPLHVIDYDGGAAGGRQLTVSPDLVIDVNRAGALTDVTLRFAQLDNVQPSRLGLAYRAPNASDRYAYANAAQPFPRGFEIGGIVAGLTSFQLTFARVDQTLLNTQGYAPPGVGYGFANTYLAPIVPPQGSLVQNGSAPTTDAFTAGPNGLAAVYLSKKAVAGTVAVAAYSAGAPPAFSYVDATNQVVFAVPLPPGARITLSYIGLSYTNSALPARYEAGLRVNHTFAGLPGAEVGITLHRLWDEVLPSALTPAGVDLGVNAPPSGVYGAVSDAVFGLDFQVPLGSSRRGLAGVPLFFGEVAASRWTPDQLLVTETGAYAGIAGVKLHFGRASAIVQYQSVGTNFVDGAPVRFYGNAPSTWANYQGPFFPQFFGFANTLGINQSFDAAVNALVPGRSATAANPALTFLYPVFNPLVAGGPGYHSAFAPNTQGPAITLALPVRIAGLQIDARLFAQRLSEVAPNANGTSTFGPQYPSGVRATFDTLSAGASVPVGDVTLQFEGLLEHLVRNDRTPYAYVPFNPALGALDPGSVAAAQAASGARTVAYPNFVNVYHTSLSAGATLPLTRGVLFDTRYSDQRYFGSYGTTLQPNVGGIKDEFDAGVTYAVPNTSSSIGLNFRNNTYKDAALPSYDLSANREDLNFTIRF